MKITTKFFLWSFIAILLVSIATLTYAKPFFEFVAGAAYFVLFTGLIWVVDQVFFKNIDTVKEAEREVEFAPPIKPFLSYHKLFLLGLFILAAACVLKAQPLVDVAKKDVGKVEMSNKNDGAFFEALIQRINPALERAEYCAALVSYWLDEAMAEKPTYRGLRARKFITKESIPARAVLLGEARIAPGMLAVYRRGTDHALGHVEVVSKVSDDLSLLCVGGNVSAPRDSPPQYRGKQGVFEKRREILSWSDFRITHFTPVKY